MFNFLSGLFGGGSLKNLFGTAAPGAGGWETTMQYGKSPISWTPDGQMAGLNMSGQDLWSGLGRGLQGAAKQMPGGASAVGAFAAPKTEDQSPSVSGQGGFSLVRSTTPQFRKSAEWWKA